MESVEAVFYSQQEDVIRNIAKVGWFHSQFNNQELDIYSVELFELSFIRLAGKAGKWQEQDHGGKGQGLHQVSTHMIFDDIIIPVSTKIEKKMKIFFFAEIFFAAVSDPNEQLLKIFFSY